MNEDHKHRQVRRRTRRRMLFSALVLLLYFSFVLNWTGVGQALTRSLGDSPVTGSLLMFVALILTFLALELLFLWLYRREQSRGE